MGSNEREPPAMLLPDLSRLSIGAPAARPPGGPMWSAGYAKQYLDQVHAALSMVGFQLPRDDKLYVHTAQYLTGTFTPDPDLSDKSKNAVLWSTAFFIEHVLTNSGLSGVGGFWVGKTRFADNNVEHLRDNRKEAFVLFNRSLNALSGAGAPAAAPAAPAAPKQKVAFLYVVVEKLGFLKGEVPQRHLLLMGHRQDSGPRHWGVPGGLRDKADSSSLSNAMREFGEEMLGMKGLQKNIVNVLIANAKSTGSLSVLKKDDTYTAWMLLVDSALKFEMAFGLPKRTVQEKYAAPLSNETEGYLYLPLPLQATRNSPQHPWTVAAPAALNSRRLILRQGTYKSTLLI